ncbi:cytochrome oxidase small assembly protein [Pulveribacter suum]|nr:cytochrome oxidase small assembly protein [Pulveribacter suum]
MPLPEDKRRANVRLGLILGSLALAFLVGFFVRMVWLR